MSEPKTVAELVRAAVRENWPTCSGLIQEWHPDDQKLVRDYSRWDSWSQRCEMLLAQRQERLVFAVLNAVSGAQ